MSLEQPALSDLQIAQREVASVDTPRAGNGAKTAAASRPDMLASLARVGQIINDTLFLDDILQVLLAEALAQTTAAGGLIKLYQPENQRFIIHQQHGPVLDLPTEEQQVFQEEVLRQIALAPDQDEPAATSPALQSAIISPIFYQGRVVGLFELFFHPAGPPASPINTFVTILCQQAAIAIGNDRRFREITERNTQLQRRVQQIQQVVESSRVIYSEGSLTDVYEELVYTIQEGTGFDIVLLSLAEKVGEEWFLRRVMAAGMPLERFRELQEARHPWALVEEVARSEHRLGHTYFIPAEETSHLQDHPAFVGQSYDSVPALATPHSWRRRDLFFMPLRNSVGHPLGLISLDTPRDGQRPDPNTARIFEIFANQTAAAIENWHLFHNTREYARQLKQLHDVSQVVLSETDPRRRLQLLADGLSAAGWERVTLTLRDAEFQATDLVTSGLTKEEHQFLQDNMLPAAVWRKRFADPGFQQFRHQSCYFVPADHPWAQENIGVHLADHTPLRNIPSAWHPHDMLCLPLYDEEGRPLALIGLDQPANKRRPDEAMLQVIELYARFAVAVIEGIQLFDQLIERNAELNAIAEQNAQLVTELRVFNEELDDRVARRTQQLHEESERVKILLRISTELTSSLDRDRVLNRALGLVNELVHASQGQILLIDQETHDLFIHAYFDQEDSPTLVGTKSNYRIDEGLVGWVIKQRRPEIVHDTRADERWVSRPGTDREHRSVLSVPLITGEEVIGVMLLYHHQPHAFTRKQLDLVSAAGIQVANAVYNTNLYDLIRDQAESLGSMMREAQIEVAKTHSILESIGDGVLVAQADGKIILVNLSARNILGLSRHELVGTYMQELHGRFGASGDSWLDVIHYWTAHGDTIEQRSSHVTQFELHDQVISVNLSPVFANRQYIGTVSIFRDITREVEVDRMKSEFVSTVSHELRTPMTSIKGYAELMIMGVAGPLSQDQNRYLQVIKKNADRLHLLVDDLLDISRIETGKTQLNLQPLDIPQIVNSVTREHVPGRLQTLDKEIAVVTEIAPAIPLANADPEKVMRILMNLVDNALNYTPSGGQIVVGVQAVDGFVVISVADSGIGIDEENLDHIFDRFYRSEHPLVQSVSGTGLGLSIVQSLVEMHGGSITAQSRPGEGSIFTFTLPTIGDT